MATAKILAAIGVPVLITFIVLIFFIYGARTKIAKLRTDLKRISSRLDTHQAALEGVASWSIAAQEEMKIPGYGPY